MFFSGLSESSESRSFGGSGTVIGTAESFYENDGFGKLELVGC